MPLPASLSFLASGGADPTALPEVTRGTYLESLTWKSFNSNLSVTESEEDAVTMKREKYFVSVSVLNVRNECDHIDRHRTKRTSEATLS